MELCDVHFSHGLIRVREDVNRGGGVASSAAFKSTTCGAILMIKIYDNHGDIIMEMSPNPLFDFLDVLVSHLPLFRSLLKGSSHQPLGYALQIFYIKQLTQIIRETS